MKSFSLVTSSRGILNIQSLNELTSENTSSNRAGAAGRTSAPVGVAIVTAYTVRIGERDRAGESTTSHSYKI
jgi:hypothetical protein